MNRDLLFISREFEKIEISKNKKYLLKYFDTPLQESFLKYVLVFGDYSNFVDHTGLLCLPRWLKKLYTRWILLEKAHKKARFDMDLELLTEIETGNYNICFEETNIE